MNPEPNQRQLDALEKYLRGELDAGHPDLPAEEAALARQLRSIAARQQPNPQFAASLNRQLAQPQAATAPRRMEFRYLISSLAGITALVLLAFLLRWLILSVAPQPPVPAISFTETPPAAATATHPAPIPTGSAQTYAPLFSESYSFEARFPASPEQANLYEQVIPETASLETARALAAKFGLNGTLYLSPETGPNGEPVYLATDGKQRLIIYSAQRYNYFPDWARMQETRDKAGDAQFAVSQAEAFLQVHNLLDFPYRVETSPEYPHLVSFIPTIDELPVRYASGHQFARLEAGVDSGGQLTYLSANLPAYRLVGNYPLRMAENAWDKILGVNTDLGLMGDFSSSLPVEYGHTWMRSHPTGETVSFSGVLEVIPSAEGGEPFLTLDGYPLAGGLSGLEQLASGASLTLRGQFIQDGEALRFQVESWKTIDQTEFLAGSLEQDGARVFLLVAEDGRRLELPELPPEVLPAAQNEEFHTSGVSAGDVFDWNWVHIGPLGGGGGGGGGLTSFAKLNLSGMPMPTATPQVIPTPLVAEAIKGQRLDGSTGSLNIVIFESKDGSRRMEAHITLDEVVNGPWTFQLEGPALTGIEKYYLQPVRVWGVVSGLNAYNIPILTLERFEPLYAGLKIQGWLGNEAVVTIQGKPVLLFTSNDGHSYIVKESLGPDFDPVNQSPVEQPLFMQGFLLPEQKWGGYQVVDILLRTYSGTDDPGNLEGLKQPPVFEPNVIPESSSLSLPSGAKIEKVELVYLAKDLAGVPELIAPIYLQPVWCFSGHYTDGTPFEIYVQALTDAYLLPEPEE